MYGTGCLQMSSSKRAAISTILNVIRNPANFPQREDVLRHWLALTRVRRNSHFAQREASQCLATLCAAESSSDRLGAEQRKEKVLALAKTAPNGQRIRLAR